MRLHQEPLELDLYSTIPELLSALPLTLAITFVAMGAGFLLA